VKTRIKKAAITGIEIQEIICPKCGYDNFVVGFKDDLRMDGFRALTLHCDCGYGLVFNIQPSGCILISETAN
jgi:hypothetical protein